MAPRDLPANNLGALVNPAEYAAVMGQTPAKTDDKTPAKDAVPSTVPVVDLSHFVLDDPKLVRDAKAKAQWIKEHSGPGTDEKATTEKVKLTSEEARLAALKTEIDLKTGVDLGYTIPQTRNVKYIEHLGRGITAEHTEKAITMDIAVLPKGAQTPGLTKDVDGSNTFKTEIDVDFRNLQGLQPVVTGGVSGRGGVGNLIGLGMFANTGKDEVLLLPKRKNKEGKVLLQEVVINVIDPTHLDETGKPKLLFTTNSPKGGSQFAGKGYNWIQSMVGEVNLELQRPGKDAPQSEKDAFNKLNEAQKDELRHKDQPGVNNDWSYNTLTTNRDKDSNYAVDLTRSIKVLSMTGELGSKVEKALINDIIDNRADVAQEDKAILKALVYTPTVDRVNEPKFAKFKKDFDDKGRFILSPEEHAFFDDNIVLMDGRGAVTRSNRPGGGLVDRELLLDEKKNELIAQGKLEGTKRAFTPVELDDIQFLKFERHNAEAEAGTQILNMREADGKLAHTTKETIIYALKNSTKEERVAHFNELNEAAPYFDKTTGELILNTPDEKRISKVIITKLTTPSPDLFLDSFGVRGIINQRSPDIAPSDYDYTKDPHKHGDEPAKGAANKQPLLQVADIDPHKQHDAKAPNLTGNIPSGSSLQV